MMRRCGTRDSGWGLLVGSAVVALVIACPTAGDAQAISAPIQIANTGGEGVNIRAAPTVDSAKIGWIPEGTSPDYNCFVWGENINGVPIWFNVNYGGVTGYYASYYDDSSYHSNEELTAKYGVPLCGSTPPPPPPPPSPTPTPTPSPSGSLVFTIFNTEGGIYYRNSPHWADTSSIAGVGVYNGDQVQIVCGAYGDPVGPYGDTAWSKVKNLTRPSIGEGWVNEHYIDDGATSGHWPTGVSVCPGSNTSGGGFTSSGGPASVFYSPNDTPNAIASISELADLNIPVHQWAVGGCSPTEAANVPSSVTTLAGWSVGRLGPIYLLSAGSSSQRANIHRIVLFDPGATADFTTLVPSWLQWLTGAPCDQKFNINSLLARWLNSNPANHLLVLTGHDSEMHEAGYVGRPTYAGLWKYYFAGIWNQPFAGRAQVCDYNNLGHEEVLTDFASVVNHSPGGCPAAPNSTNYLTAWNP
jgi:hypothetical protein